MQARVVQFLMGLVLLLVSVIPTLFAIDFIKDTGINPAIYSQYPQVQGLQLLAFFITLPGLAMIALPMGRFGRPGDIKNVPRYLLIWAMVFAIELAVLIGCVVLSNHLAGGAPAPRPSPEGQTELAAGGAPDYNSALSGSPRTVR